MTYEDILAECIERIEHGATVEECVSTYPEHAETLAPTLHFVQSLQEVATPMMSDDGFKRGRAEVTQAASDGQETSQPFLSGLLISLRENYFNTMPALRWAVAAFAAVVLVFGSLGAVQAADESVPGSPLYTVKRAGESVRGLFANEPEARARWHATLAERRLQEALILSQRGQRVDPQLLAEAQQHIQAALATSSGFEPAAREELQRKWIGDFERIQSEYAGGDGDDPVQNTVDGVIREMASPTPTETAVPTATPTATAKPAVEIEFEGVLESIDGSSWTIDGRTVRITGDSEIGDSPEVGDRVKVHVLQHADGTLVAREIDRADGDDRGDNEDDQPQVSATPAPTDTPEPTETPAVNDDDQDTGQNDQADDDRSGPSEDHVDDDQDDDHADADDNEDSDADDDDHSGSDSGSDDGHDDSDDQDDDSSDDESDSGDHDDESDDDDSDSGDHGSDDESDDDDSDSHDDDDSDSGNSHDDDGHEDGDDD